MPARILNIWSKQPSEQQINREKNQERLVQSVATKMNFSTVTIRFEKIAGVINSYTEI